MSNDTTTQSQNTKSTSQHRSWEELRTPIRQFASCVLVDIDDTLDSIFSSDMAIGKYVAQRAGIGINAGRIRGINSKIRGGEVQHTGVVPFLKKFESNCQMLHSKRHQRWISNCPLSYLAPRNKRYPRSQKQQRNRR